MVVNQEQELVFTGSGEGGLKVWKIDRGAFAQVLNGTETGEVPD
jgi:U3 small nucleolar RNA-associated protein 12